MFHVGVLLSQGNDYVVLNFYFFTVAFLTECLQKFEGSGYLALPDAMGCTCWQQKLTCCGGNGVRGMLRVALLTKKPGHDCMGCHTKRDLEVQSK